MDLGQNNHNKKTTPGGDSHSVQGPIDPSGLFTMEKLIESFGRELVDSIFDELDAIRHLKVKDEVQKWINCMAFLMETINYDKEMQSKFEGDLLELPIVRLVEALLAAYKKGLEDGMD